jgi:diguanylate cyclase (GGDEF)-like protein
VRLRRVTGPERMADDEFFDSTVEVTIARDMRAHLGLAPKQAALLVIAGPKLGDRIPLDETSVTIGRGSSCELSIDADSISRQHARVERSGNAYRVVDLNSTNGTFVNERRITEHTLVDGDRIMIGKAQIKFVAGGNIEGLYHEELQRLAKFDGLTSTLNKASFDERLNSALVTARRGSRPVALVVFDLDHFKSVNDTHGHTVGDVVLRQSALTAQMAVGPTDDDTALGRVGGEEFAVLLVGRKLDEATKIAERIRETAAGRPCVVDRASILVTVSLGVAEWNGEETSAQLFERADSKLYEAKRSGRNKVCS